MKIVHENDALSKLRAYADVNPDLSKSMIMPLFEIDRIQLTR